MTKLFGTIDVYDCARVDSLVFAYNTFLLSAFIPFSQVKKISVCKKHSVEFYALFSLQFLALPTLTAARKIYSKKIFDRYDFLKPLSALKDHFFLL